MGPNLSFLGFVKNTPRDSSKGWAYIDKHMWYSSILRKHKEVLARNGGGKFWKGICFIFVLIGSKCRSWTWHPLFIIWNRFGKSICLSFILITRSFHVSYLIQCCQIIGRVIHMFKRSPSETYIESAICSCFILSVSAFPMSKSYSISPSKSVTHFVSLMGDTSRPSYDESCSVDFNSLSGNKT